jgi:hypothetical protein
MLQTCLDKWAVSSWSTWDSYGVRDRMKGEALEWRKMDFLLYC